MIYRDNLSCLLLLLYISMHHFESCHLYDWSNRRVVNVDQNSSNQKFLKHLQKQVMFRSQNLEDLKNHCSQGDSTENPFQANLQNALGPKTRSKLTQTTRLVRKISKDSQISIFGFVKKEIAFFAQSKKVLEFIRRLRGGVSFCERLQGFGNDKIREALECQIEEQKVDNKHFRVLQSDPNVQHLEHEIKSKGIQGININAENSNFSKANFTTVDTSSLPGLIAPKQKNVKAFTENNAVDQKSGNEINSKLAMTPEAKEPKRGKLGSISDQKGKKSSRIEFARVKYYKEKLGENRYIFRINEDYLEKRVIGRKIGTEGRQTLGIQDLQSLDRPNNENNYQDQVFTENLEVKAGQFDNQDELVNPEKVLTCNQVETQKTANQETRQITKDQTLQASESETNLQTLQNEIQDLKRVLKERDVELEIKTEELESTKGLIGEVQRGFQDLKSEMEAKENELSQYEAKHSELNRQVQRANLKKQELESINAVN